VEELQGSPRPMWFLMGIGEGGYGLNNKHVNETSTSGLRQGD
jgi:hypothetical protein